MSNKMDGVCQEILERTEWVAIVTRDSDTGLPPLVATWGDYIRNFGIIEGETILIPAGRYHKTEANLRKSKSLQLLIASKQVERSGGRRGQGCILYGEGEIQTEGEFARRVKEKYTWARGALVVRVQRVETLL